MIQRAGKHDAYSVAYARNSLMAGYPWFESEASWVLCTDWQEGLLVRLTISLLVKALGSFILLFSKLHADSIFSLNSYLKRGKNKESSGLPTKIIISNPTVL